MQPEGRSWRYFALLALALTAGAVRMDEELLAPGPAEFHAMTDNGAAAPVRCDERLDAAWLTECTDPKLALLTSR